MVVPRVERRESPWAEILFGKPVILVTIVAVTAGHDGRRQQRGEHRPRRRSPSTVAILGTIALHLAADQPRPSWHRLLEGRALDVHRRSRSSRCSPAASPSSSRRCSRRPRRMRVAAEAKPYRPLELEGRDIYIREGCYICHSQMIRTFAFEAKRYGDPSTMAESVYDHPFQWGSKRTGPDLAREGGKYPNLWHYRHMIDPREVSPGSIMPPFPALATDEVDASRTADKMRALRSVGVPYEAGEIESATRRRGCAGRRDRRQTCRRGREPRSIRAPRSSRSSRTCSASACTPQPAPSGGRRPGVAREVKETHVMHKNFSRNRPLLVLPLVAMFLFIAVWVVAADPRDDALARRDGGGGAPAAGGRRP